MTKKYVKFISRGKPANIAERLFRVFKQLPYDEELDVIDGMYYFRRLCNRKGWYYEDCPESFDSSRVYTFLDGSRGYMGNPYQEACIGFFYPLKRGAKR